MHFFAFGQVYNDDTHLPTSSLVHVGCVSNFQCDAMFHYLGLKISAVYYCTKKWRVLATRPHGQIFRTKTPGPG